MGGEVPAEGRGMSMTELDAAEQDAEQPEPPNERPGRVFAFGVVPETPLHGELTDADLRGCRFIEGEPTPLRRGMFCSAPPAEPGGSWCSRHRARVWTLRAQRRTAMRKAPTPARSPAKPLK
jgi:hypothetical protein